MKNRFLAGEQAVCPDCIAYSIVLNKFAQESMHDFAEEMLFEMVDDYLNGNDSAKPRTRTFYSQSKFEGAND
jgi:pentatricopeptide repeat protein